MGEEKDQSFGGKVEVWLEAESISDKRWVGHPPTEEYKVHFVGGDTSWETTENVSLDLIRTFERSHPEKVKMPLGDNGQAAFITNKRVISAPRMGSYTKAEDSAIIKYIKAHVGK